MADVSWYCLTVVPQKEFLAGAILEQMGFKSFVPREYKYLQRKLKGGRIVIVEKAYPLLGSRYVFIGTDKPWFPWMEYHEVHLITGYVDDESGPALFSEKSIKKLDRITNSPYNIPISRAVRHKSFRLGSVVIIKKGPFSGFPARILEASRGKFHVLIENLLGTARAVWVDADSLEHHD